MPVPPSPPRPIPPPVRPPMRHRTVVLRHALPGGGWHLDWLIDRVGGREAPGEGQEDARDLVSFRVMVRPDDPVAQVFDAERMTDHRAIYLTREGDIGEGRGVVARVGAGWCAIDRLDDDTVDLTLDLGRGARRLVGHRTRRAPDSAEEWRFVVKESPGR